MALHLHPLPKGAEIVPFPDAKSKAQAFVEGQLGNMLKALIVAHGGDRGRVLFSESAIAVVAATAAETGHLVATRYACDAAFERVLQSQPATDEAMRLVTESFIRWLAPQIASDEDHHGSLNEVIGALRRHVMVARDFLDRGDRA